MKQIVTAACLALALSGIAAAPSPKPGEDLPQMAPGADEVFFVVGLDPASTRFSIFGAEIENGLIKRYNAKPRIDVVGSSSVRVFRAKPDVTYALNYLSINWCDMGVSRTGCINIWSGKPTYVDMTPTCGTPLPMFRSPGGRVVYAGSVDIERRIGGNGVAGYVAPVRFWTRYDHVKAELTALSPTLGAMLEDGSGATAHVPCRGNR